MYDECYYSFSFSRDGKCFYDEYENDFFTHLNYTKVSENIFLSENSSFFK